MTEIRTQRNNPLYDRGILNQKAEPVGIEPTHPDVWCGSGVRGQHISTLSGFRSGKLRSRIPEKFLASLIPLPRDAHTLWVNFP